MEQIFTKEEGYEILAKLNDGRILLQTLNSMIPDVILLDIGLLQMDGLTAASIIKTRFPKIKIVFMSRDYGKSIREFMNEKDIEGFIIKDAGAPQFKKALADVVSGARVYIIPEITENKYQTPQKPESDFLKAYRLTSTEVQIICMICKGSITKEIAAERKLAIGTIDKHRQNIFRKIGARSMVDVVNFARDNGLCGNAKNTL